MPRHGTRDFESNEGSESPRRKDVGFSEPRRPTKEYRHAGAGGGEIDHAALTRKIIARFPKILAALAK